MSRRTAANGKVVVEHGTEALQGAVIDGTVSVSDAAKVAKAPPEVQDKAVEAVRNGKAKSAAAAAREAGDDTEAEARPDPVDAEGEVIPVRALAAFERAKEMDLWCRQVNQLVSRAVEFAKGPGGRCLNAESVKIQLQNAKGTVWANRPTHVCPYCRGEEGKAPCKPCGGEGWVPKHVWVSAPGNNKKGVAAP